jgi:hypothetical protein
MEIMMRTAVTALAATLLLPICGAAFAAGPPGAPNAAAMAPPAKKARVQSPEDVVCKSVPEPGSRISNERVCMTRGEWDQQGATARNALMGSHPGVAMPK